jgi:hypothetical protein
MDGPVAPAHPFMMDETVKKTKFAWQPLTARGIAAFATASLNRLLLTQFVFALFAAAAFTWFLHARWFPRITEAIQRMPAQGEIRSGTLDWRGDSPVLLAAGRFLSITVDLQHEGKTRSPAHIQVEFGAHDVKIYSLLGFLPLKYPRAWILSLNRVELEPWWGAWRPALLAIACGSVVVGLLLGWACLATLYFLPAWLIGFFANRKISRGGCWRLAGAALMPGTLFLTAAIITYGLGLLDLLRLAMACAVHLVIGWVFVALSPLAAPRDPAAAPVKGNPFLEPPKEQTAKTDSQTPVG